MSKGIKVNKSMFFLSGRIRSSSSSSFYGQGGAQICGLKIPRADLDLFKLSLSSKYSSLGSSYTKFMLWELGPGAGKTIIIALLILRLS